MKTIDIAGIPVGAGHPPVFLAEIGALFNRDIDLAIRMIEAVAKAAESSPLPVLLKGELLHDSSICLDDETMESYRAKGGEIQTERYRGLIERKVLDLPTYARLLAHCHKLGLATVMSVYDRNGADFARANGVAAIKLSSGNLTHLPLIRHVAGLGLPVLLDNGRASLADIDIAVRAALSAGCKELVLEHSPDGHPAPASNHNLRTLDTLRRTFDCPVGLSCHHHSTDMLFVAIGIGVDLLEKNVVVDDTRLEQDYAIAMRLDELPGLLARLADASEALGRPFRDPSNTRGLIATSNRMGLVCARNLEAGQSLTEDMVSYAFPCRGISANRQDDVMGWRVRRNMEAGEPIAWHDLQA